MRRVCAFIIVLGSWFSASALDPSKALTQYSRTVWTQQHGLPQDAIKAITQTSDGYLWIGTDEGLARFDGYEFSRFSRDQGQLPSNSISSLAASKDGFLWIGTPAGLTQYRNGQFRTLTTKDGLPADSVSSLLMDSAGILWIVAGGSLARLENGKFANYLPEKDIPLKAVRVIALDSGNVLYAAGSSSVVKFAAGKFVPYPTPPLEPGALPVAMRVDRAGNLWVMATRGLVRLSPQGQVSKFGPGQGLPNSLGAGALWEDRHGSMWVGSGNELARMDKQGLRTAEHEGADSDSVSCMFEDREGNLWVGSSDGLARLRDDTFTVFGTPEGLPSDEPNAIYQDRQGSMWVGFLDRGAIRFVDDKAQAPPQPTSMPTSRVFGFRETRSGELLISAGEGLFRVQGDQVSRFVPPDPLGRKFVYDALERADGSIWLALASGLAELRGKQFRIVVPGGELLDNSFIALEPGPGDTMWAASRKELWRVSKQKPELVTKAEDLGANHIRSLLQDRDGTLWIATFGGGLSALRGGATLHYTTAQGLLSNNISKVLGDGEFLWLSTTRGICRVLKQEMRDLAEGRIKMLHPVNYGVADGLRSAQYAPTVGAGGVRRSDGSIWFTTAHGVAVYGRSTAKQAVVPPQVMVTEISADGRGVDPGQPSQISPGSGRLELRYTAIHLSAPDRVEYAYKLEGLDSDWIPANGRRVVNYNNLRHGNYRFFVKASLPDGPASEAVHEFELLPQFYETTWFRALLGLALVGLGWVVYRVRVQQVSSRFKAVLQERARLAREVHDTLAQGFVGISSQLDALSMCMPENAPDARTSLDLARRMARHSLTEARRSVLDLRAAALDDQDLAEAVQSGASLWTAGSGVDVEVEVHGGAESLPEELAHHVLRIAQEAVTNAAKHAAARKITVKLEIAPKELALFVSDDGRGFAWENSFASSYGHFGLLGMRERAERIGGELCLDSAPGKGTRLSVKVPLH